MNTAKPSAQDTQNNPDRTEAVISGINKAIKVSAVPIVLGAVSCGMANMLPALSASHASIAITVVGLSAMFCGVVAIGVLTSMGADKLAEESGFTKLLKSRRGEEHGQSSLSARGSQPGSSRPF